MAAYHFGHFSDVTDPEKLRRYKEGVLATVERYGGRFLTDGGQCDAVEGEW